MQRGNRWRATKEKIGFYLIDKAPGPTSRVAVKTLLQVKGKGFGVEGILDPFASGLLIAATGNSTRFLSYFLPFEKTYAAEIALGTETDTLDLTGAVTHNADVPTIETAMLTAASRQFTGVISQVPPVFSNLKVDGERAHELVRRGVNVQLPPRNVKVHSLELSQTATDRLHMRCCVGSGTYIRSLARDIARALGTFGHLTTLRRVSIGHFVSPESGLKELTDSEALDFLPEVSLTVAEGIRFNHGAPNRIAHMDGWVRVNTERTFIGVGRIEQGVLHTEKPYPEKLNPN